MQHYYQEMARVHAFWSVCYSLRSFYEVHYITSVQNTRTAPSGLTGERSIHHIITQPMLIQSWASVAVGGPTLKQPWFNILCVFWENV